MKLILGIMVLAAVIAAVVMLIAKALTKKSSGAITDMLYARGNTTPPIAQYSLADSLLARGRYAEAAEAYDLLAGDFPDDPEPPIRLARLQRDYLKNYDAAATAYRRALAIASIAAGTEIAVLREVIELYTHKLRTPEKALPYLSRLAQKHPDHPAAEWARSESKSIKSEMQAKMSGGNDADTQ